MFEDEKKDLKNIGYDGGYKTDFFSENPCYIGYLYLRFLVDGSVQACCIASNYPTGNLHQQSWKEIWFSLAQQNFRDKLMQIAKERFHLKDPEWSFCKQCSHFPSNQKAKQDLDSLHAAMRGGDNTPLGEKR